MGHSSQAWQFGRGKSGVARLCLQFSVRWGRNCGSTSSGAKLNSVAQLSEHPGMFQMSLRGPSQPTN